MTTLARVSPTRKRLPGVALAVGAIAAASATATVLDVSPLLAVAGGVCCLVAVAILRQPFLGVLVLVGTVQQIDWGRLILPGRIGVLDILTLLTVAGIVIEKRRSHSPGRPLPEDLALRMAALFGLVVLIGAIFTDRPSASLDSQKLIGYLVVLFLIVHETTTTRRARALMFALVLSTAVSSGVAISDHYLGTHLGGLGLRQAGEPVNRQSGSAGNASNAAKQMATGGALAAMLFLRDPRLRWLTGATVLLAVLAVPTTAGRAGLLALGLAFAWILFKYRHHRRFGAVLLLASVLAVATIAVVPSLAMERLLRLTDPMEDGPTANRLTMYTIGLDMFKRSPFLGVGPGQFEREWIDFRYRWLPSEAQQPLHNAYLGVMVDLGIFALIFFLALLWITWRGVHRAVDHAPEPEQRWLAEAMELALVLYLLVANTGPGQRQLFMWLVVAISLAMARVARISERTAAHPTVRSLPADGQSPAAG